MKIILWTATAISTAVAGVLVMTVSGFGGGPPSRVVEPTHRPTSPPLRTARGFFLEELRQKVDGDWAAVWRTLYPAHRLIASRSEFVSCERALPFAAPLRSLRVVRVAKALVHVPGRSRLIAGVALQVHVELDWYGPRDPITFTHTFHLVPVHGHWTWLLSPSRYRLYLRGACLHQLAL